VVASRIAAIPELVREGETGWLVSAEGVDDLADALRALLSASAQHLDELGSCGRALVLQRHDVRIEVERLEALFRGVPST
jgi:glycosyltransferase involved in cell wall biosynthesis